MINLLKTNKKIISEQDATINQGWEPKNKWGFPNSKTVKPQYNVYSGPRQQSQMAAKIIWREADGKLYNG